MSEVKQLTVAMEAEDAELQHELRAMFAVDTQQYLQTYINLVQKLKSETWKHDIQDLYRYIHTIKGGAVTVGADAMLFLSTAIEEILSELRYLQTSPPLENGYLGRLLLEAGELLAATLEVEVTGEAARQLVQPSIDRIQALRKEIELAYLPDSNEHTQICQEFAEHGFDLVVLELEMAIEQLPSKGTVTEKTLHTAKQTLQQLWQIGKDLEFDPAWKELLNRSKVFFSRKETDYWQENWPKFLSLLKDCARNGGIEKVEVKKEVKQQEIPQQTEQENTPLPVASSAIQIPVSLERIEQSAEYLIETLLAARVSQGCHKTLQSQLSQLLSLAQDSLDYVTGLRQLQDDYVLLDNLQTKSKSTSLALERYRKGYNTINRLLEASLRLSELGAEASTTARKTAESFQVLERNLFSLQRKVEESRLISFRTLAFRAKAIIRDLINRFGKPAKLVVQGEDIEIDVGVVQALEASILHLLRNAYDHGLESKQERYSNGKPEEGTINVSLRRVGKFYLVEIKDDGGGIDGKQIQDLARTKGMQLTKTDTPNDILAVISQPGFSSKTDVNEISGRGVGMDVVVNKINSLKGQISLETTPGKGTTFRLLIPVPRLLVRCVLVKAGDRIFAIPSEQIVTTTLKFNFTATQKLSQSNLWQIEHDGLSLPGIHLLDYWEPTHKSDEFSDTAICLRIRCLSLTLEGIDREAWLLADELLEELELLINPLPKPLISPQGLMGVSLQNDGKLIPVLEPEAIAAQLWTKPKLETQPVSVVKTTTIDESKTKFIKYKTILVVDDAALLRRRLEMSLTTYGYFVHTCSDGLEAWNWLRNNPTPAMIITDIEMPIMDGFTLINKIRLEGMTLPIMVVSSRLLEDWSKEARRLGANDYLTKGFTTSELINKVSALINS